MNLKIFCIFQCGCLILEILENLVIATVLGYPITKDKKKQMFDGLLKHMKEVFDDILEEVEGE